MIETQKDDCEIFLDLRRGWVIRTPLRVPDSALLKMCRHAVDEYTKKLVGMPDGPAKRRLGSALRLLDMMHVVQEVVAPKL
jgi:hypothetical protein